MKRNFASLLNLLSLLECALVIFYYGSFVTDSSYDVYAAITLMMIQKDQDNNKEQKVPFNLQFIHVLQLHSNNYLSLGSLWLDKLIHQDVTNRSKSIIGKLID